MTYSTYFTDASITAGNGIAASNTDVATTIGLISPVTIVNGGTGVKNATITPTANAFAAWDANRNLSANSFIDGYATTVTAAATTTLTAASAQQQYFTGATTQTVIMPVVSTLVLGQSFTIINESSGVVTVRSSGTNVIESMAANTSLVLTVVSITGTDATSWNAQYTLQSQAIPNNNLLGNNSGATGIAKAISLESNSLGMFASQLRVARSGSGFIDSIGFYGGGLQVGPTLGGQSTNLLILSDDFKLLHTAPSAVFLYDSAPAGAIIFVDSLFISSTAGSTTPYTGGGNLVLQYGATPGGTRATVPIPPITITTLSTGTAQFFGASGILYAPTTSAINISSAIGLDLYLYVDAANFAGGDGDFTVLINYHFVYP
jgi:hypothetical protein